MYFSKSFGRNIRQNSSFPKVLSPNSAIRTILANLHIIIKISLEGKSRETKSPNHHPPSSPLIMPFYLSSHPVRILQKTDPSLGKTPECYKSSIEAGRAHTNKTERAPKNSTLFFLRFSHRICDFFRHRTRPRSRHCYYLCQTGLKNI